MKGRVFVTGATGYLGGAIAVRLARAGYQVSGLTRSAEKVGALAAAGVHPVVGDLERAGEFHGALRNSDFVVHAALDAESPAATDERALAEIRHAVQDGR